MFPKFFTLPILEKFLTPALQVRVRPASRRSDFAHEEGAPELTEYKKKRGV
jgi:hypothetical protein